MTETFALTPEQSDLFDRRGVVRVPGFYARGDIDAMADRLWADLDRRHAIQRDRPETWTVAAPAHFQSLRKSGAFSALRSTRLCELADAMLGAGNWDEPPHWGGPLVTFPTPQPILARPPWHLDIGGVQRLTPLPILRVFTFLAPSRPGGGGTLYVAGSHRLAIDIERARGAPVTSAQVREQLRSDHPWFARLLAAPIAELNAMVGLEAQVGGHAVRLQEMTGGPGDLILMNPAILHGAAHNRLDSPRIMLTEFIVRRGVWQAPEGIK
jgi:hypothetical protein